MKTFYLDNLSVQDMFFVTHYIYLNVIKGNTQKDVSQICAPTHWENPAICFHISAILSDVTSVIKRLHAIAKVDKEKVKHERLERGELECAIVNEKTEKEKGTTTKKIFLLAFTSLSLCPYFTILPGTQGT